MATINAVTGTFRSPTCLPVNLHTSSLQITSCSLNSTAIFANLRRNRQRRRSVIYAMEKGAEEDFKRTVAVDQLIDTLRAANPGELEQVVVENVLSFDTGFWIRLATRADTCISQDDRRDYEEMAATIMRIVERLVHKVDEKIEESTNVLTSILKTVIINKNEEITWPPRDPYSIKLMEQELIIKEKEGLLDESFLSEVNAQLSQARQDGDKPGLEAMLRTVLQLYAKINLNKRSYSYKGGEVVLREKFLESIIEAPESKWNKIIINGLKIGKGEIYHEDLYSAIKKRIERILIRTEAGSYEQRILVEYLMGIETRTREIVQVLQGGSLQ